MGIIIGINAPEKNTGSTSLALTLGQSLYELTDKSVGIIDLDNNYPEIKEIMEKGSPGNFNIDNIMSYATVEEIDLEQVIKSNAIELLNSKVTLLYGTIFTEESYTDIQLNNLLQNLKKVNKFTIIDFGTNPINKTISNHVDLFLALSTSSIKQLRKLLNRKDLLNDKSEIVINYYNKGLGIEKEIKNQLNKKIYAHFPYDKQLMLNMNKGYLNLETGEYQKELYNLCEKIIKRFKLEELLNKKSFLDLLWGKSVSPQINKNDLIVEIKKDTSTT